MSLRPIIIHDGLLQHRPARSTALKYHMETTLRRSAQKAKKRTAPDTVDDEILLEMAARPWHGMLSFSAAVWEQRPEADTHNPESIFDLICEDASILLDGIKRRHRRFNMGNRTICVIYCEDTLLLPCIIRHFWLQMWTNVVFFFFFLLVSIWLYT